jgi:N-formylglutamate deformylase
MKNLHHSPIFALHQGTRPLLISMPHVGTQLPDWLAPRLVPRALAVEDTDWHLERLYAFAKAMGASILVPQHSRFVVDLNRPSDNAPMYPGANNTELCPTRFFTGDPIYRDGQAPEEAEIQQRVATYWQPYHSALAAELQRIKAAHGHAVLFDAHSIQSTLPWLFDGQLPALNLGTVQGTSCAASLRQAVADVCASPATNPRVYSHVLDGRFKGGYITRQYGRPADHIHAVQLEMCWRAYMLETAPYDWHPERAAQVQPLLQHLVQTMLDWSPSA